MSSTTAPTQPPGAAPRPDPEQHRGTFSTILKPVFIPASVTIFALIALAVGLSVVAGDAVDEVTMRINTVLGEGLGWWYVIAVNVFLVFAIYFAVSRIGKIKLGRDDESPEFGIVSWFLMLFSAGMGIGLVFFGVAEPLSDFVLPPEAFGNAPGSTDAARESVPLMMLQWGLHPWAIYSIVGLGMAYMTFRRGRPLSIRWLLEPLMGRERVEGWIGHVVDTVAIVGTMFGVATSFGFGISQILGGFEYLGWAQPSNGLIIGLVTAITAFAMWSVLSGVHKGLKWLSNLNMSIAALLALLVFLLGPTLFLLKSIPQNLGNYLSMLPSTMLHVGAWSNDGWEIAWTIGYWGWWTSWAPFVGMFIARISRGRTVREFIVGVLAAPTLVSIIWFTVFGNSAIKLQQETGSLSGIDPETGVYSVDSTTSLFAFFEQFPTWLAVALSIIAMIVIVFFFVTSADSGSLVMDMLANGGVTTTPVATRVYWTALEGAAAAVLLVFGGSTALTALQTLALSTAAPFSVILVLACFSLLRAFRYEVANMPVYLQVMPAAGKAGAAVEDEVLGTHGHVARAKDPLRGMRGISTTYGGLSEPTAQETIGGSNGLLSVRRVNERLVNYDPDTGAPLGYDSVEDPIGGETFDTEEFAASQEYVNRAGSVPTSDDAAATADDPGLVDDGIHPGIDEPEVDTPRSGDRPA